MNCEAVQAELKAYQDGELDRLGAWRVRRHVGRCAPCAEELQMLGKLNALLLSADIVQAEPRASASGFVRKSRRAQWVSAGAAVLAAVLLAFGTTGRNDVRRKGATRIQPEQAVAYAAAMQALVQLKSWKTCHLVARPQGAALRIEEWLRVPDEIHHEVYQGGALTLLEVQNANESWRYEADKGVAVHSRTKLPLPQDSIMGTALGPLPYLERLQEDARRAGALTIHERQDHMPDGRRLRVIDIRIDMAALESAEPGKRKIRHEIVYLDAQTGRLVKWDEVTDRWNWSCEILSSDRPLPNSLFVWQPPPGVKVVEFTDWWQARKDQKLATAASQEGEVTVHAIDVAANGDVWLTVSGQPRLGARTRAGSDDRPMWAVSGMTLTDEQGRTYVQFFAQTRDDWPANAVLLGFTPLQPRRPNDPLPVSFTANLRPDFGSNERAPYPQQIVTVAGLAAPAPAAWIGPLMTPLDAFMSPSAWDARYADSKQRARQG